ncbi:uncharacterized protein PV09_06266 [Verruconis gallopava]|uniref:Asp/Glu/hydantoin racemase n=1 Tax=Verruconis gallopava TaxID=253628 RepID=A0A0D1XJI1_9PEZI|nr:uncharacterized protein PV09_06266 [Verruconis gallopava]KIW02456.1 hypothetical protein PV09_06266 [Verruconis gallopava]
MSTAPVRLGIIVPSSNTSLEPLTQAIVDSISTPLRQVTVHFTRIRMTQLDLSTRSAAQFAQSAFVPAAQLLADAKASRPSTHPTPFPAQPLPRVDAIGWSGTSAGWLGFSQDEQLCELVTRRFGVPATTSTLALNRVLRLARVERLGLVTPYTSDMNQLIMRNYAEIGFPIAPEREKHLGITENGEIGSVGEERLTSMVRDVVDAGADAVTTFCTNWNAAHLVDGWEKQFDVPVFDSVATVVWDLCRMTEVDMSGAGSWGRMFF